MLALFQSAPVRRDHDSGGSAESHEVTVVYFGCKASRAHPVQADALVEVNRESIWHTARWKVTNILRC